MGDFFSKELTDIPHHVSIIMDGNRRWASQKSLSCFDGHKQGVNIAQQIIFKSIELGISYLTLYAFSSENWGRDPKEVSSLMDLLRHYLETEAERLHKNNVRLLIIGERYMLPENILYLIKKFEYMTKQNTGITLLLALSYGSRAEITQAVKNISQKVLEQKLALDDLTEEVVAHHLYTYNIPDPDVLIRTGGEKRISNYLLWQLAYTELVFVNLYWPEFTTKDFVQSLLQYQNRKCNS